MIYLRCIWNEVFSTHQSIYAFQSLFKASVCSHQFYFSFCSIYSFPTLSSVVLAVFLFLSFFHYSSACLLPLSPSLSLPFSCSPAPVSPSVTFAPLLLFTCHSFALLHFHLPVFVSLYFFPSPSTLSLPLSLPTLPLTPLSPLSSSPS